MDNLTKPSETPKAGMPAGDYANLRRIAHLCNEVSKSPHFSELVRDFYRSAKLNCDLLLSGAHTVQDATVLGGTE